MPQLCASVSTAHASCELRSPLMKYLHPTELDSLLKITHSLTLSFGSIHDLVRHNAPSEITTARVGGVCDTIQGALHVPEERAGIGPMARVRATRKSSSFVRVKGSNEFGGRPHLLPCHLSPEFGLKRTRWHQSHGNTVGAKVVPQGAMLLRVGCRSCGHQGCPHGRHRLECRAA